VSRYVAVPLDLPDESTAEAIHAVMAAAYAVEAALLGAPAASVREHRGLPHGGGKWSLSRGTRPNSSRSWIERDAAAVRLIDRCGDRRSHTNDRMWREGSSHVRSPRSS
jgi:hypothetical protein